MSFNRRIANHQILVSEPESGVPIRGVMVMLHGGAQTNDFFFRRTEMAPLLNAAGYIALYPQAKFRTWGTVWGHRESDLKMINSLHDEYTHPNWNFGGLSDGAFFSNYLAFNITFSVNCVVSSAGGLMGEPVFATKNRPSVLIIQGNRDRLVKPEVSENLEKLYKSQGCTTSLLKPDGGHKWYTSLNEQIITFLNDHNSYDNLPGSR